MTSGATPNPRVHPEMSDAGRADGEIPRPAKNLDDVAKQLVEAVLRLDQHGRDEDLRAVRAYQRGARAAMLELCLGGDLEAPQRLLARMEPVLGFVARHRPIPASPQEESARELCYELEGLRDAESALRSRAVEAQLSRTRAPAECAVLRVLLGTRDYLPRGEVHKRLTEEEKVSAVRVGQILSDLHRAGLALRQLAPSQGAKEAAYYTLSPRGEAIASKIVKSSSQPDARSTTLGALSPPTAAARAAKGTKAAVLTSRGTIRQKGLKVYPGKGAKRQSAKKKHDPA